MGYWLVLAAMLSAPLGVGQDGSPLPQGARISVIATVTILRAGTSDPSPGEHDAQRIVRRGADGQVLVEYP